MVAVTVGPDLTEAIPLLDDNGSGSYIKGRNNIDEFRQLFLGGFTTKLSSNPFLNKSGLFAVTADSGVGTWTDALVASTGGAGTQAVLVAPFRAIVQRSSGHGVYLCSSTGTVNVPAPAADGANPRWDLLCVMAYDKGAFGADAQHGAKFIWVTGDAAGSPTVPGLPAAVTDAMVIARLLRPTSDNTIAAGDITQFQTATSLHGAPRPLMGGDLVTDAGRHHGEIRLRSKDFISSALQTRGHTQQYDYWDSPSATWKGINAPSYVASLKAPSNGTLNTIEQMDSATQCTFNAVAGHTYSVRYGLGHSSGADGNRILCAPRYAAGPTVGIGSTLIESTRVFRSDTGFNWTQFENEWIAPTTGQYTIGVGLIMFAGTSGTVYGQSSGNGRMLTIYDGEF